MKTSATLLTLVTVAAGAFAARAQENPIPLWAGRAPGAQGSGEGHTPDITPYFPAKDQATGAAVVVCPGGGYGHLALDHEGDQIGRWLSGEGIAAFILRYRHAPDYRHPIPLTDAQRALRTVRARATEWGVDPQRIGILGFSAGGHLTASAGTHFAAGDPTAADPIERVSSRPDVLVLLYPVITMTDPYTHAGSRRNLLGDTPDPGLVKEMSAELKVSPETPPTFIVQTNEDKAVPAENCVMFYLALRKAKVPAEIHIYEKGSHGFGLAPDDPVLSTWPRHCIDWLRGRGFLK